MDYLKYKRSRDLSWKVLVDNNITELPVKVSVICKNLGISLISYERASHIIKAAGLEEICSQSDGITFMGNIFYNQKCSVGRQRFTVAHELGHIFMHTKGGYNREPSPDDPFIEQEANVFAGRLLAPACVLWGLGVSTAEKMAQICNISLEASRFRLERLATLREREQNFIREKGKSCFLMSSAERKVYNQFYDYIKKNKL